jgi:hypothetical protein
VTSQIPKILYVRKNWIQHNTTTTTDIAHLHRAKGSLPSRDRTVGGIDAAQCILARVNRRGIEPWAGPMQHSVSHRVSYRSWRQRNYHLERSITISLREAFAEYES